MFFLQKFLGRLSVYLFFMNFINGYAFKTHEYLGELTEEYLKMFEPEILYKIKSDIHNESLSSVSTWADRVKYTKEYYWSKHLHYIDIMECGKVTQDTDNKYCKKDCITSTIVNYTKTLKESHIKQICFNNEIHLTKVTDEEKIKFLIHFIQDFNQPMHLFGFDKGGNGYEIIRNKNNRNKTTNLHYLWDSEIPEYFVENFEYKIHKIDDTDIRTIDEYYKLVLLILNKNYDIACNYIYGKWGNIHYIKFEEYFKQEHARMLFDNYLELIIKTLKFIYN